MILRVHFSSFVASCCFYSFTAPFVIDPRCITKGTGERAIQCAHSLCRHSLIFTVHAFSLIGLVHSKQNGLPPLFDAAFFATLSSC